MNIKDQIYTLDRNLIPKGSLLDLLLTTQVGVNKENDNPILSIDEEDFIIIYNYLTRGKLPDINQLTIFDYFGIELHHSYELSYIIENYMRQNMYQEEFKNHEMNSNPYYQLIKVNELFWNRLKIERPDDHNLLFNDKCIIKQKWEHIQKNLSTISFLFEVPGIFVAGGFIFATLFGSQHSDIDIFFYNCDEQEAIIRIKKIVALIGKSVNDVIIDCTRTSNALTVTLKSINLQSTDNGYIKTIKKLYEYQIVLRLYHSPSEIIHGFDVDSCCMGKIYG